MIIDNDAYPNRSDRFNSLRCALGQAVVDIPEATSIQSYIDVAVKEIFRRFDEDDLSGALTLVVLLDGADRNTFVTKELVSRCVFALAERAGARIDRFPVHILVSFCRGIGALCPGSAEIMLLLGILTRRNGCAPKAAIVIYRAMRIKADVGFGAYNCAFALAEAGADDSALELLRTQDVIMPGHPDVYNLMLGVLDRLKRFDEVERVGLRLARLSPTRTHVWPRIVLSRIFRNDYLGALTSIHNTMTWQPNLAWASIIEAEVEARLHRPEEAKHALQRGLTIDPVGDHGRHMAISLLPGLGDAETALRLAWTTPPAHRRQDTYPTRRGQFTASVSEILCSIWAVIPRTVPRENALVYIHDGIQTLGHLVFELSYLRSMYAHRYETLVVICRPRGSTPGINPEMFEIATRGFTVVEIEDRQILNLAYSELGVFVHGRATFLLHSWRFLARAFHRFVEAGGRRVPARLSGRQHEVGRALFRRLGVPEDVPIVALHVRRTSEPSFRNGDIARYTATIRRLLSEGYAVVRIGDPSMPPLPDDLGPLAVDLAHRCPSADEGGAIAVPYALGTCAFMVAAVSGPSDVARAFLRPLVSVNVPLYEFTVADVPEVLAFRRFVDASGRAPRRLSWTEVMGAFPCFGRIYEEEYFQYRGWRLDELAPHEIDGAVKELQGRLAGPPGPWASSPWQVRFRELSLVEDRRRAADRGLVGRMLDWFGYGAASLYLADSQRETMPEFLG